MERIIVAVGSIRPPKVNAVAEALKACGHFLHPHAEFQIESMEVPSGVSATPSTRYELMAGARGRAMALRQHSQSRNLSWNYCVGLEGGLDVLSPEPPLSNDAQDSAPRRLVFLQSWAFIVDQSNREAYGQSGGILIPEPLAAEVLDRGVELSAAIDAYAGGEGIRDIQGAWGVLTRNLITRQEAFRIALIHAFAPFFNRALYP